MDIRLYETQDILKAVCHLAEKLYGQKQRVLILCANPLMVQALDQALWQFKQLSFIPHMTDTDEVDPKTQPIFITSNLTANANQACAVICCDIVPPDTLGAEILFGVLTHALSLEFTSKLNPAQHFIQKEEGGWTAQAVSVAP